MARLQRLYAGDPALAQALARARGLRQDPQMPVGMDMAAMQGGARNAAVALTRKAGEFLARPGGPQVAVIEMNGWDTHANQAAPNGALAKSRGTTVNRLLDEAATLMISEFDAETRFRLRAARGAGQVERALALLDKAEGRTKSQ